MNKKIQEADIRSAVRSLQNFLTENGVPCFLGYYIPKTLRDKNCEDEESITGGKFAFDITLPEEIQDPTPDVLAQYGRFKRLMRAGVNFDKEDFHLDIH